MRCRRRILLAALFVVAGTMTACVPQRHLSLSDIRPLPTADGAFATTRIDGLRAALAASPGRPIRVLAVHGMLTSLPGYSATMQQNIAGRLGLTRGEVTTGTIVRNYTVTVFDDCHAFPSAVTLLPSTFTRTAWVDNQGVDRLVYYEVLWAPFRDQIKDRFLAAFEARSLPAEEVTRDRFSAAKPNTDSRDAINADLKDNVIVGGMADAMIVLGPVGDVLRDDLHQALVTIAADEVAACQVPLTPRAALVRRGPRRGVAPSSRPATEPSTMPGMMRASQERSDANVARAIRDRGRPPAIGLMRSGERLSFQRLTQGSDPSTVNHALRDAKFFVLTESLGSFLVLDMQQRFATLPSSLPGDKESGDVDAGRADATGASAYHLLDRATVFMRANQVALLELARLQVAATPDVAGTESPNPLIPTYAATTQSCVAEPKPTEPPRTIYVAFNDANDLLGFELPPYLPNTGRFGPLVNVSVRNPGFDVPFIVKSPGDAHRNSDRNPAVIEAVVEGIDIPPAK